MSINGKQILVVAGLIGAAALIYWLWPKRRGLGDAALDREMARKSLREEREAIQAYTKRLRKAENPRLKKALRHARKEEREHAAMFRPLAGDSTPPEVLFKDLVREPDPAALDVAQDLLLERGLKLSNVTRDSRDGRFGVLNLHSLNPADAPVRRVTWSVIPEGYPAKNYKVGVEVTWPTVARPQGEVIRWKPSVENYASRATAEKHAAALAWSLTKALKRLQAEQLPLERQLPRANDLIQRELSQKAYRKLPPPKELYGARKRLAGPSMLKVIASESRSPEEYARRAEAWASTEATPPSIAKIATAYRGAKPGVITKLVRKAREQRLAQTKARWKGLIARREEHTGTW